MSRARTQKTIEISIPVTIPTDALIAAVESGMITGAFGYGYWCDVTTVTIRDAAPGFYAGEPAAGDTIARNVLAGGTALFHEYDESTGKTINVHTLTREKLIKGFGRWVVGASRSSHEDEDTGIVDFEIDAAASDLIMQYALFGKQVYG